MALRLSGILAATNQFIIVAETADGVCGWLQALHADVLESGVRVEIVGMIVTETMRRRRIGSLLIQGAERWAQNIQADAVVVRSNISRTASHAFYFAQGYTHSKTQAVYRKPLPKDLAPVVPGPTH